MIISGSDLLSSHAKQSPSLVGSGLFPERGQLLLTAPTGVGKSVVALDMCLSLILQQPLFNAIRKRNEKGGDTPYFPVHQPCKILYFDAEVGQIGLKNRFKALTDIRCDSPEFADEVGKYITFVTEHIEPLILLGRDRMNTAGFANIRKIIQEHIPDPNSGRKYVVVFDPLGDFHEIEENESSMRFVFQKIRALQNEFNFSAIIPHHESDRTGYTKDGPIERKGTAKSRGHSSITQKIDTMLSLTPHDSADGLVDLKLDWAKTRHAEKPLPGYVFVDYGRMYLEWIGPAVGAIGTERVAFRAAYKKAKVSS